MITHPDILTHPATLCYDGFMAKKTKTDTGTPRTLVLSFRLPEQLIQRVDALAEQELRSRVNMIHVLLEDALRAREQTK